MFLDHELLKQDQTIEIVLFKLSLSKGVSADLQFNRPHSQVLGIEPIYRILIRKIEKILTSDLSLQKKSGYLSWVLSKPVLGVSLSEKFQFQ